VSALAGSFVYVLIAALLVALLLYDEKEWPRRKRR
jgi:hypothetical protein